MGALDALDVFGTDQDASLHRDLPTAETWFEFEERAAVLEFDAGYSRPEAERLALWKVNASHQRKTT